MKNTGFYQYYVEGDDEKRFMDVLKLDLGCIVSGKIEKFNVVQEEITITRIRTLKRGTTVVLVYDTDVENTEILQRNIDFLRRQGGIKEVICIPQVGKLEHELARACGIKDVRVLTGSKSMTDFKRDFLKCKNLAERLKKNSFDISKMWERVPNNTFAKFGNGAEKIRVK